MWGPVHWQSVSSKGCIYVGVHVAVGIGVAGGIGQVVQLSSHPLSS